MEITNYSKEQITLSSGDETFRFINLAQYNKEIKKHTDNFWILNEYQKKVKDDISLTVIGSFDEKGTYRNIAFGYGLNNLMRRTLECNKEGNLERDYIFVFNPMNKFVTIEYDASLPPNIPLEEYLTEDYRIYKHNTKASFINNVLPDSIATDFLEKKELYGDFLDTYAEDYPKLKEILKRIHTDDEMYNYCWNDSKVYSKKNTNN